QENCMRMRANVRVGRRRHRLPPGAPTDPIDHRAKVEWVIVGTLGQSIGIIASHPRAGTVRPSVILA
ncbi:MAG: hypothetical protein KGR25_07285, partial [Chloroflexi bacterium]|nr:hypothetical protein [Chloroflexota bacterium]